MAAKVDTIRDTIVILLTFSLNKNFEFIKTTILANAEDRIV